MGMRTGKRKSVSENIDNNLRMCGKKDEQIDCYQCIINFYQELIRLLFLCKRKVFMIGG